MRPGVALSNIDHGIYRMLLPELLHHDPGRNNQVHIGYLFRHHWKGEHKKGVRDDTPRIPQRLIKEQRAGLSKISTENGIPQMHLSLCLRTPRQAVCIVMYFTHLFLRHDILSTIGSSNGLHGGERISRLLETVPIHGIVVS